VGNSEVLEDDYGIAVIPEHFIDIVTGVDPSKFAGGSGRIGEEVLRRGFGFGVVDNAKGGKTTKRKNNDVSATDSFCLNPLRHGMQTSDSHFFCSCCRTIWKKVEKKRMNEVWRQPISRRDVGLSGDETVGLPPRS
jgi:hypothetical protein